MQEEFFLFLLFFFPAQKKLRTGGSVSQSSRPQARKKYDRFSGYLRGKPSHGVRARRREKGMIVFPGICGANRLTEFAPAGAKKV